MNPACERVKRDGKLRHVAVNWLSTRISVSIELHM